MEMIPAFLSPCSHHLITFQQFGILYSIKQMDLSLTGVAWANAADVPNYGTVPCRQNRSVKLC